MSPAAGEGPAAAAGQDLTHLAGLKLGNYRLERLLGVGRMGAVYLAKDEALLRPTAVKLLSWRAGEAQGQDPIQWFLAEARLVARISDPGVVQIYGAARQGEHCYLAMEYVPGRSAAAVVERGGPMPPAAATEVLIQVASALAAAHRAGVVHRDVKPANVLLGPGGVAKLGDFGMALGPPGLGLPTAHLRVGTPLYTAPEIWRGEPASAASDLYALGATYFQLLTGRPPFPAGDAAAVEQAHLRWPVPDPRALRPDLPASSAALVRRALAKAPRERQGSALELAAEGRRVLAELAGAARPAQPAHPGAGEPPPGADAPARPAAGSGEPRPAAEPERRGPMELSRIAALPGVQSALLCQPTGALLEAARVEEADGAAAVVAVLAGGLGEVGEELGLGPLCRLAVSGPSQAMLIVSLGDALLSAAVRPASTFPAVEHAVDAVLQG